MKTNTVFSMSILLLLLSAVFYAPEAGAQSFSISVNGNKALDYRTNQTSGVDPYPYNALSLRVNITNVPGLASSSYRIDSNDDVECRLRRIHPDGSSEAIGDCGTLSLSWAGALNGATRTYTQIPVTQGLYEVYVRATARNSNTNNHPSLIAELTVSWFVHSQTPSAPIAQHRANGNVLALAGADGNCNPVVVPITAEHQAMLFYSVDDGPPRNMAARLPWSKVLGEILHGFRYVNDELVLEDTALEAGQTLSLRLWHTDHLNYGHSEATSAMWTVECPFNAVAELGERPPAKTYASEATFSFSMSGTTRTAQLFCSLDDLPFKLCTSPYTARELQAGEHVFRVYAGSSAAGPSDDSNMVEHRWMVSAPDIHLLRAPSDGPDTKVVFEFQTREEVPASFSCSIDGRDFSECSSPLPIENLNVGMHSFEVRAANTTGTGTAVAHSWEVLGPEKTNHLVSIESAGAGCSATGGLPLGFIALAGLWGMVRQRRR